MALLTLLKKKMKFTTELNSAAKNKFMRNTCTRKLGWYIISVDLFMLSKFAEQLYDTETMKQTKMLIRG